MDFMFAIVFILSMFLVIYIGLVLPYQMAEERNRSGLGWLLISVFFSPLVAIVGLLVLGSVPEQP